MMDDNEKEKRKKINQILFAGASARIQSVIEKYSDFPIKISIESYSANSFYTVVSGLDEEHFAVAFHFPYAFTVRLILPIDLQEQQTAEFDSLMKKFSAFDRNDKFIEVLLFKNAIGIFKESALHYELYSSSTFARIDENSAEYLPVAYIKNLFEYLYMKNGFSTPYSITEIFDGTMIVPKTKKLRFTVIRFDIEGEYKIRKIATKYPNPFFNAFEDDLLQFLLKIEELRKTDSEYLWKAEFKLIFPRGFSIEN